MKESSNSNNYIYLYQILSHIVLQVFQKDLLEFSLISAQNIVRSCDAVRNCDGQSKGPGQGYLTKFSISDCLSIFGTMAQFGTIF